MRRLDFSFALLEYTLVVFAIGMACAIPLHDGWRFQKWWGRPLFYASLGLLITTTVIQFIIFVKARG